MNAQAFEIMAFVPLCFLQELNDNKFLKEFEQLAKVCKVPVNEALPGNMISLLTNQLSSYIHYEEEIKTFTFIHESIMEVLMSSFVRFHPQHILESKYYF